MEKRTSLNVMLKLIGLVKPLVPFMIIAIITGVIGFLAATAITVLGGFALLNVIGIFNQIALKLIFILVCVFAVLRGILRYCEQTCNHYIAFKILALIRDKVFRKLRILAPAKLECKEKGNLISVITSDIELLEVFYAHTISPICIAIIISIVMTIFIGSYHYILGLIALFSYIIIGIVVPLIASKHNKEQGEIFRDKFGKMNSYMHDSLRGLKEIIQYGMGEKRNDEIGKKTEKMSTTEYLMKRNATNNFAITSLLISIFSLSILFVSLYLYSLKMINIEGVIVPTITIFSSFGSVIAVANLGSSLSQTIASGNRVLDILNEKPQVVEIINQKDISFDGAEMKDVNFAYENEKILDEITISIPKNKKIGIVGKSGSGKSTILKLLMRFWDRDDGKISYSNIDIKNINTRSLRKNQAYVTQETALFHDSIEKNILLANELATHKDVVKACKKASLHNFIVSLPNGYNTEVGELGSTLSGGEKQRIGLARAFLSGAELILLDEPTSNLDSLNEAVILKAINEEKGKTVVLVSHRESTMKIANDVFNIESGRFC